MTGKVFADSADVYQDQAKILFDYYRQAAERIVSEEMNLERQMDQLAGDKQQAEAQAAAEHQQITQKGIIAGVCGVLGLILLFVMPLIGIIGFVMAAVFGYQAYQHKQKEENANTAAQQCAARIEELQQAYQGIRRDYRVNTVGVAYVPVAQRVSAGDKSLMVDFTGDQAETDLLLTLINQPSELRGAVDELRESIETLPIVESNNETEEVDTSDYSTSVQDLTLHDYMGTIDRQIRNVRYLVGDSREVAVSVPAVPPASDRYRFLAEHATADPEDFPVVSIFDPEPAQQKVQEFAAMGELNQQSTADGSGDVELFTDIMRQLAQSVDLLAKSRTASVSALNNYASATLGNVLKASFDQYSPTLEAEEIERIRTATFNYADEGDDYRPFSLKESSRVRYDLFADAWVADDGSRTSLPFGMHQVESEVLMPVIGNLMRENRVERLRIYNDIQNQKIDYLNQWHRDTDDFFGRNRSEANGLIQRMNEAYAEYVESYTNYQQQSATFNTMKRTGDLGDSEVEEIDNQTKVIEAFAVQAASAKQKQDEFSAFMERIREDIDESAAQFGHVEFYEASLRDSQARDNARAAANVRDLEPRRRNLATVNAYVAQNGTIPPEPNVSERLDEDFTIDLSRRAEWKIAQLGGEVSVPFERVVEPVVEQQAELPYQQAVQAEAASEQVFAEVAEAPADVPAAPVMPADVPAIPVEGEADQR